MADYYDTGTVSVLSGNRTVTGTGTSWAGLIRAGDTLEIGGRQMRVASVESATSLTLKLPAPAAASGAYAIWFSAPSRTSGLQALADTRRLIEAAEILMAQRGDYAVRAAPLNAPPAAPVTGDLFIIGTAPTGTWAGYAGHLAQWTGTGWAYTAPQPGMRAYVLGAGINWQYGEAAWGIVPGLVSALGVSGNIADALGSIFPRGLSILGTMGMQSSMTIRDDNNINIWMTSASGASNRGLLFYNISDNSIRLRLYTGGSPAIQEIAITATGQISLPDVTPANPWSAATKRYVDLATLGQWNELGSSILARNTAAAEVTTGSIAPASDLRLAKIMTSGAGGSNASAIGSGSWRLCGSTHQAGSDDISLYRRIA